MPVQLDVVDPARVAARSGIALAIAGRAVTRTVDQRHIAFLLEKDDGSWWLVHLGWDNHFLAQPIEDGHARAGHYGYAPVSLLHEYNEFAFKNWLFDLQANNEGRIPYSIALSDQPYFDQQGNVKPFGIGEGFTCASFVKAVFEVYAIRLLDTGDWPVRESDAPWQRYILQKLRETGGDPAKIAAQQPLIGQVARLRPEEVLGAAIALSETPADQRSPLPQRVAEPLGGEVRGELVRLNKI
ncbi:hypothetical protein [Cupriavidus numazuensis]|uniref:hypothetical protein n=1 Tax=Cupriavidus numazuensis TaxID=221992 RepID=UPI001BAD7DC8|nr:hypothetical protein [Cupriavidus numazuensis]